VKDGASLEVPSPTTGEPLEDTSGSSPVDVRKANAAARDRGHATSVCGRDIAGTHGTAVQIRSCVVWVNTYDECSLAAAQDGSGADSFCRDLRAHVPRHHTHIKNVRVRPD
jgi:acyl-CoA reductase-like NAD-dependent aldehyde dehydrogenase